MADETRLETPGPSPYVPADVEYELLASLVGDGAAVVLVDDLAGHHFDDPHLGVIFDAIKASKGRLTQSTLYQDLTKGERGTAALQSLAERHGAPGDMPGAIARLFADGAEAGAADILAERVRNQAIVRLVRQTYSQMRHDQFVDKTEFALALANEISNIAARMSSATALDALSQGAEEELERWCREQRNPDGVDGVRVNLGDYDKLTGGLQPGELVLIGGHSGEGKSQVMCHMAMEACTTPLDRTGETPVVAYFSLEMSRRQIAGRWIAKLAGCSTTNRHASDEDAARIAEATDRLFALGREQRLILVEPHMATTIEQITRELIRLKRHQNLGAAFVDYAQLVRSAAVFGSKYDQLADVAQRLKLLSIQMDIPIVLGVQLNRAGLTDSPAGRPRLHHIADSLDLIRSADTVHMIWVPSRHLIGDKAAAWKDIAILTTEKRRNGAPLPWQYYEFKPEQTALVPVPALVAAELKKPAFKDLLFGGKSGGE